MPDMSILKNHLKTMWDQWFKEANSKGLFTTPEDISFAFSNFKYQTINMIEEIEKEVNSDEDIKDLCIKYEYLTQEQFFDRIKKTFEEK